MTDSPIAEAIAEEAQDAAERIKAEAEEDVERIEQEAEARGRREGEKRALEILSEAESRAQRSKIKTRSVEEGESRELAGKVKAEILGELFRKLSARFIDELDKDNKTYRKLMEAIIVDVINRLPSSGYRLQVPKGHRSLYTGRTGILKAVERGDDVTLSESSRLRAGFVLRAEDTGATVNFDSEGYIENIRENVLRELNHAIFE